MPSRRTVSLLITASEAFPVLERAFLTANSEICAGFRVFDPETRLRSEDARKIGETWFDLVTDTLSRGVAITLTLSDFDPVVRPALHRGSWRACRMLIAAAELSNHPELLQVRVAMHPARVGWLPRILLWPKTLGMLREIASDLNDDGRERGQVRLRELPGLQGMLDMRNGEVAARPWPPAPLVPATHHQKIAVFDKTSVYLGGLDLDERRYDTLEHARRSDETWYDVHMMVEDSNLAAAARHHLQTFWRKDAIKLAKNPETNFLRTLSAPRRFSLPYMSPKQEIAEIAAVSMAEVAKSTQLIYLESQFFRDRHFTSALCKAAKENPELSVILVLPAAPEDVAFETAGGSDKRYGEYLQARYIDRLRRAFGERLFVGSPARPVSDANPNGRSSLARAPIVYVHAKVSVFDDRAAVISSANLNGRSHYWDTEAGMMIDDAETVTHIRERCMAHWLPKGADAASLDPATAVQSWAKLAAENQSETPERRRGFLLPYPVAPARRFGRNLPGVPEEMV